ncbi:MAG: hypothetical protein ACFFDT_09175 [Candidatus Hodarchaeota archaeon]
MRAGRGVQVGYVGGSRRGARRHIYRPPRHYSPYGRYSLYYSSKLNLIVCFIIVGIFFLASIFNTILSPPVYSGKNIELSEGDWFFKGGTAAPDHPISYSVTTSNNAQFLFFFTDENPDGWATIFRIPEEKYEYFNTTNDINGKFDPPSAIQWYFIIYNDPDLNQGTILVTYDVKYPSIRIDPIYIYFLAFIVVLSVAFIGIVLYRRKQENFTSTPSVSVTPSPIYDKSAPIPKPVHISSIRKSSFRCKQCGETVDLSDRFCVGCGLKLEKD